MWGCNRDAATRLASTVQVCKNYFILQYRIQLTGSNASWCQLQSWQELPAAVLRLQEWSCTRTAWCTWGLGEGSHR